MLRRIRLPALVLFAATALAGGRPAADAAPATDTETLAAVIMGPGTLRTYTQCSWYVSVSGGTPPYSYSWDASHGSGYGVDDMRFGEIYGPGSLYVTVTDYNGQDVTVRKGVNATSSGPLCP